MKAKVSVIAPHTGTRRTLAPSRSAHAHPPALALARVTARYMHYAMHSRITALRIARHQRQPSHGERAASVPVRALLRARGLSALAPFQRRGLGTPSPHDAAGRVPRPARRPFRAIEHVRHGAGPGYGAGHLPPCQGCCRRRLGAGAERCCAGRASGGRRGTARGWAGPGCESEQLGPGGCRPNAGPRATAARVSFRQAFGPAWSGRTPGPSTRVET
jgi:hypothetical protein